MEKMTILQKDEISGLLSCISVFDTQKVLLVYTLA